MKTTGTKKILLINVTCGQGSTGRIVTGIYDELTKRGHTCMAAYGRGSAPSGYNAYRIGSELDVRIHGVLSRVTDRHGFYSTAATKRFIEKIKEFGPDIVHMHNIHGYYLNVKLLFEFLAASKIQVIWTLHDCWSFTGHCTHFEYLGCDKWKSHEGCSKCPQLKEYPKSILMDGSVKNHAIKRRLFTAIDNMLLVTPSEWLKGKVEESYMGKYPVTVVPTGINLNVFKPTASKLRERYGLSDRFVILGAANPWRERKGLYEFIKLSKELDDKYRIVMLGLKPEQKKLLPKEIIALGRTDSIEEMAQWYSAADAYVNLTFEDTFPTTNIEALACGTPVVTYRVGGSPESLTDECGFGVEKGSIEEVIDALNTIKNGKDMSPSCIDRAALYSSENRFSQYFEEVYAQIL